MSYRFGSLNNLKRLFVERVFDGDEILAWGQIGEDYDEPEDMTPLVQKEMFQIFEESRKRMEQRFSIS